MYIKQALSVGTILVSVVHMVACTYELAIPSGAGGAGGENQNGNEGDCLDALDGDGDGLIDCADPDCNPGYECVANAPPGFSEHARIFISPVGDPPPLCAIESETPVVRGKSVADAACTKCDCQVDVTCAKENVHLYSTTDCMGNEQPFISGTDCVSLPTPNPTGSYVITYEQPTAVKTISQAVKTPESPWAEVVNVCPAFKTTGMGCGAGQFCVPRSASPYRDAICVQAPGNQQCSGEYGVKVSAFDDVQDNRTCTLCDCAAEFKCNGYAVSLDSGSDCMSGTLQSSPLTCTPLTGNAGSMKFATVTSEVTKKDITGGIPTGTADPQNARTFCCTN